MGTLDWTFGGTWPYPPRWFDTPDGRLHYAVLEELWLGTFPDAVVTRLPDAGHFVQEDAYERVPALLDHLGRDDRRSTVPGIGPASLPRRDRTRRRLRSWEDETA